jgi:trimeric autotransporter adhesin
MNSIHQRNFKLRASGVVKAAITLLFLVALFVPMLSAQVAPAGYTIGNQATATYNDAAGISRQAFSNLVQTSVTQVYAGSLTQSQTKYASVGTQVVFPHTYTNTGNGPDSVKIAATDVGANLSNIAVYVDANGDGIPDNTTNIAGVYQPVAAGAIFKFVVVGTLNASSSDAMTITPTSNGGGTVVPATNTDTVTYSNNAVIQVTKSLSASSGASGSTVTVTLTYTNTGNATAANVILLDPLATIGNFTYATGTLKWNGAPGTDTATAGFASGFAWQGYGTNLPQATITSVAPGVTGTVSFNVTANTPASWPAVYSNYEQYRYGDGTGATIPSAGTYLQSNTSYFTIAGTAALNWTAASTGTFTSAAGTSGAPDTDVLAAGAVKQGGTLIFNETLQNQGQVTDTYNITYSNTGANPFPAGTTFQIYRADGLTPLTDTNGDGIIDVGPVSATSTANIFVKATLPPGFTWAGSQTFAVSVIATSTNQAATGYPVASYITDSMAATLTAATVDLTTVNYSGGTGAVGTGKGADGIVGAANTTGNPSTSLVVPFWVTNTSTTGPDAYNLAVQDFNPAAEPISPVAAFTGNTMPPSIGSSIQGWTGLFHLSASGTCATLGASITATPVVSTNQLLCLELQVPASYTAGNYDFVIQAQSSGTGAIDQMHVRVTVNTLHQVSVTPNNQNQIYAGGTVNYKHVISNGGNVSETVVLVAPSFAPATTTWTAVMYDDTGSIVGQLDNTDVNRAAGYSFALPAGTSVVYYVKVQVASSANPGDTEDTTFSITYNGGTTASADDTTTVINDQLKLLKSQWVDTACTHGAATWTTGSASAASGQCVMYQIVATNNGTTSVTGVTFADAAPPYTTYLGAFVPTAANTCSMTNPVPVALAGTAPFSYAFTGSMTPGCTATIVFEVKLN